METKTFREMKYRKAGNTGLWLSEIGLGLWKWGDPAYDGSRIGEHDGFTVLDRAAELGITHWDTACSYNNGSGNSERLLGNYFSSRGSRCRDQIIVATKIRNPVREVHQTSYDFTPNEMGSSRRYIMMETDRCLKRLKTDRIDLMYHHMPNLAPDGSWEIPLEETWSAFDDLVRQGKILYVAVSNRTGPQLAEEAKIAEQVSSPKCLRFAAVQNKYNLLERNAVSGDNSSEDSFFSQMNLVGSSLIPLMPLAAGMLTGRYLRNKTDTDGRLSATGEANLRNTYLTERNYTILDKLSEIAHAKGCTITELAISWLLSHEQVASVITGITRFEQLEVNARASNLKLSQEELTMLNKLSEG